MVEGVKGLAGCSSWGSFLQRVLSFLVLNYLSVVGSGSEGHGLVLASGGNERDFFVLCIGVFVRGRPWNSRSSSMLSGSNRYGGQQRDKESCK